MLRKVDQLGRVVIPREWITHSGIKIDGKVMLDYNRELGEITIKKYEVEKECCLCKEKDSTKLINFKDKILCNSCVDGIKKID